MLTLSYYQSHPFNKTQQHIKDQCHSAKSAGCCQCEHLLFWVLFKEIGHHIEEKKRRSIVLDLCQLFEYWERWTKTQASEVQFMHLFFSSKNIVLVGLNAVQWGICLFWSETISRPLWFSYLCVWKIFFFLTTMTLLHSFTPPPPPPPQKKKKERKKPSLISFEDIYQHLTPPPPPQTKNIQLWYFQKYLSALLYNTKLL